MLASSTIRPKRLRVPAGLWTALLLVGLFGYPPNILPAADPGPSFDSGAEVEIHKKGLGKEVIVKKGTHEWYMLMEVTPDNTVIVRQHKDGDTYVLDESETHDRTFTPEEVDSAINAFASSAQAQAAAQH
ncbi:hypothetical protein YTPLAS18_35210 [Nitrospira sp.]|nr:hypothetical protein YTPLAS18_35210 [Nitrospira sp.]